MTSSPVAFDHRRAGQACGRTAYHSQSFKYLMNPLMTLFWLNPCQHQRQFNILRCRQAGDQMK